MSVASDLVEVLLPNSLAHGFDYSLPEGMQAACGSFVIAPFAGREMPGIIIGAGKSNLSPDKIKKISRILDFPAAKAEFIKFIKWTAWYNAAASGAVARMVLPVADIYKPEKSKQAKATEKSDIITIPELSEQQNEAADILWKKINKGHSVTLLDGVTGSGKTEVYFEVIARLLAEGNDNQSKHSEDLRNKISVDNKISASSHYEKENNKNTQILVLLPEIALSVQWLARFRKRFGFEPTLWNSNVTPARRRAAWQQIARGEARVIVGARSALFLPYKNLSLLVVDEEHDGSYKQEEGGVIYNARDMAIARAMCEKFPVILVSATPALETVWNVAKGKYTEVTLPLRHAEAQMPQVRLIDMRQERLESDSFIAHELQEAIAGAVSSGHQAMLFLNRRGYAPLMLCRKCGHRFQCPNCSAWLVNHKKSSRLQCHHCDYHIAVPDSCPACSAQESLHACGPGVERIVEETRRLLPQARIATLASDSATNHQDIEETVLAMERREIDILVGTQMLAKGHHFSGLAIVGVIDADLGLIGGDLRAAEKTYQLLHQVSGRAGREQIRGHVYLQSYQPQHPVIQALLSGDRKAFFAAELAARKQANMPPFSRLAALIVEGADEQEVIASCKALSKCNIANEKIRIYGPAPAPLRLLRGKFRYRFLVNANREIDLADYMLSWTRKIRTSRSVIIKIDIDPMSFV